MGGGFGHIAGGFAQGLAQSQRHGGRGQGGGLLGQIFPSEDRQAEGLAGQALLGLGGYGPSAGAFNDPVNRAAPDMPSVPNPPVMPGQPRGFGIPDDYLRTTRAIESRGDDRAVSSTGATGRYQFTRGTWNQFAPPGADRRDPAAQESAMQGLTQYNQAGLSRALGRPPTGSELYLAHQQGLFGALKLLQSPDVSPARLGLGNAVRVNGGDPSAPASAFVSKTARMYDSRRGTAVGGQGVPAAGDRRPPDTPPGLTLDKVVKAVHAARPDASPALVAKAVEAFLPYMDRADKSAWRAQQQSLREERLSLAEERLGQQRELAGARLEETRASREERSRLEEERLRDTREARGLRRDLDGIREERMAAKDERIAGTDVYRRAKDLVRDAAAAVTRAEKRLEKAREGGERIEIGNAEEDLQAAKDLHGQAQGTLGTVRTRGLPKGEDTSPPVRGPLQRPRADVPPQGAPASAPLANAPPQASGLRPVPPDIAQQAREAIASGKPRAAVIQRLQEHGFDPAGF